MELVIAQTQDVSTAPYRVDKLVDSFIEAQDVKQSSKALYKRTLRNRIVTGKQIGRAHV